MKKAVAGKKNQYQICIFCINKLTFIPFCKPWTATKINKKTVKNLWRRSVKTKVRRLCVQLSCCELFIYFGLTVKALINLNNIRMVICGYMSNSMDCGKLSG